MQEVIDLISPDCQTSRYPAKKKLLGSNSVDRNTASQPVKNSSASKQDSADRCETLRSVRRLISSSSSPLGSTQKNSSDVIIDLLESPTASVSTSVNHHGNATANYFPNVEEERSDFNDKCDSPYQEASDDFQRDHFDDKNATFDYDVDDVDDDAPFIQPKIHNTDYFMQIDEVQSLQDSNEGIISTAVPIMNTTAITTATTTSMTGDSYNTFIRKPSTTNMSPPKGSLFERLNQRRDELRKQQQLSQSSSATSTTVISSVSSLQDKENFSQLSQNNHHNTAATTVHKSAKKQKRSDSAEDDVASEVDAVPKPRSKKALTSLNRSATMPAVMPSSSSSTLTLANVQTTEVVNVRPGLFSAVTGRATTITAASSSSATTTLARSLSSNAATMFATTSNVSMSMVGEDSNMSASASRLQAADQLPPQVPLRSDCNYEVLLLIDRRERSNALILGSLVGLSIRCELANLAVGDFLWVARPTNLPVVAPVATTGAKGRSKAASATDQDSIIAGIEAEVLVLDCIVERKSIPDLASSLMDGRYQDQKCRLKSTGIRSCLYIIEGEHIVVPSQQKAISAQHIKTAMAVTHVEHSMHILRTRGMDHTISMLQHLHKQTCRRFEKANSISTEEDPLMFQRFSDFQNLYGKKAASSYKQLFGHQLRQIYGCSTSAANALMSKFGTTAGFMEYLTRTDPMAAERMLENLQKEGDKLGRFGPKLAKRIMEVYLSDY